MSEMELVFAEEKYNKSGQLDKVRQRTKVCESHGPSKSEWHCLIEFCVAMEVFSICAIFCAPKLWLA